MLNLRPAGMSDEEDEDDDIDFSLSHPQRINSFPGVRGHSSGAVLSSSGQPQPSSSSSNQPIKLTDNSPKLTFWQRKELAFKGYGKADTRPQDKYRDYILHRRQLNNGSKDSKWLNNLRRAEICNSIFPLEILKNNEVVEGIPQLYTGSQLEIVNEQDSFQQMLRHLQVQREIAIDLEGNTEHSYLEMTTTIQIGTTSIDYIVDVFPLVELIKTELKNILEDPLIIKYICGGNNDVIWLKRCFFIDIVAALDLQILFQEILRDNGLQVLTKIVPFQQKKEWYHRNIGIRTSSTQTETYLSWERQASIQKMSFDKIADLFYPGAVNKDAQVADFRPRELDDPQYQKLLKYARDDVHILQKILVIIRSNVPIEKQVIYFANAFDQTKALLNVTYKPKVYTDSRTYLFSKGAVNVNPVHRQAFEMIYDWRRHCASLIDESPSSMFTEVQLVNLLNKPPQSFDEVANRTKVRIGNVHLPSESISRWGETLLKLINEGEIHLNQIWSIKCHNCRQTVGHAGWGCPEPNNPQNTRANIKENPEANARLNRKKNQKKKEKEKERRRQALLAGSSSTVTSVQEQDARDTDAEASEN